MKFTERPDAMLYFCYLHGPRYYGFPSDCQHNTTQRSVGGNPQIVRERGSNGESNVSSHIVKGIDIDP